MLGRWVVGLCPFYDRTPGTFLKLQRSEILLAGLLILYDIVARKYKVYNLYILTIVTRLLFDYYRLLATTSPSIMMT